MTAYEFASALMAYSYAMRGSVTSWGRTAQHNQDIGGDEFSIHIVWLAADVVYDEPSPVTLREAMARKLGLLLIPYSDHDHLQPI